MVHWKASSFPGSGSLPTLVVITGQRNFLSRVRQELVHALSPRMPRYIVLYSVLGFPFPLGRSRLSPTRYLVLRILRETARRHPLPARSAAGWGISLCFAGTGSFRSLS